LGRANPALDFGFAFNRQNCVQLGAEAPGLCNMQARSAESEVCSISRQIALNCSTDHAPAIVNIPRRNLILRNHRQDFPRDNFLVQGAALDRYSNLWRIAMEHNENEGRCLAAEFMAKLATRPIKATYDLATLGAKTRRGGEVVTASTGMVMDGHRIACVGDVVRYPDGTESKIVSGAGSALAYHDRPMAIVGSATDNGDAIIGSLQRAAQIREYADDDGIPGLLQAGYLAPTGDVS
jgi:uncharacterized Zn-binding protein involved in type VI secretion